MAWLSTHPKVERCHSSVIESFDEFASEVPVPPVYVGHYSINLKGFKCPMKLKSERLII